MRVPFGSFSPDRAPFGNTGSTVALNVIPRAGGFRPLPGLTTFSDALTARCQGAFFATDSSGNVYGFAGDATKLYRLTGGSTAWDDATRTSGGAYSTPATGIWSAAKFGNDVLMTNFADDIQAYTIGSSSDFAALAGSPPKAKYLAVIGDFVVAGFLNVGGTIYPERIQWCAIRDHTSWPTPGTDAARVVQADRQDLFGEGGWVQGLAGGLSGANGAILQERALWRMIYTGPPTIFSIDQVEGGRGTPAPSSIAQIGGTIFYLGEDGFYRFDGQSSLPIGAERVDQTFFDTVDVSYYDRVSASVDPVRKLIIWAYPTSSADGTPNRQLIYNWQLNEWSEGDLDLQMMMRSLTFGVDLDTDLNASETGADDDSWPSLDSRFWTGGRPGLAAFDTSNQLAFFTGPSPAAAVETGEFELMPGRAGLINNVWPLVDANGGAPGITAQVRHRYRLGDMPTAAQAYAQTAKGHCYARSRGRYFRVRVDIDAAGSWDYAQGVDVNGPSMEGQSN